MTVREIQVDRWTHIWIGDMPDRFQFNADKMLEQRQEKIHAERMSTTPPCIGISYIRQIGKPEKAGVLGASFVPDDSDTFVIQVLVSDHYPATPTGGLSEYSAQTILEEAVNFNLGMSFLGPGLLRFDKALDHPVDSAPYVWEWLVRSIITLMALNVDAMTDRDIAVIVKSLFAL